jgi:DNA-binding CsgD family transcriptional regulator
VTKRDIAAAIAAAESGLAYCRERDLDSWTLYMNGWCARLALDVDDWKQAEEAASEVLRRPDVAPVSAITAKAVMARLRARRGQPGALGLADQAVAAAVVTGEPQRLSVAFIAAAEVRWLMRRELPELIPAQLAQVAHDSDPWDAEEIAVWAMRNGLRLPVQSRRGSPYSQSLQGAHARAVDAWLVEGSRYEAALAALDSSDPDLIRRGVEWLRQLGADGVLDRAGARLRDVGLRGPRASTAQNPAGLTDREDQVLQLLAEGLSNAGIAARLVLSKRTVDHHVSAVLRKLNVTTRAEAVRWATSLASRTLET